MPYSCRECEFQERRSTACLSPARAHARRARAAPVPMPTLVSPQSPPRKAVRPPSSACWHSAAHADMPASSR